MNRQPSLYDPCEGSAPPPEQFAFITVDDADAKAFRSFWRGALVGAATIAALAWSLPAFADPLSISGTIVDLQPAEAPAVAVVTMANVSLNGPLDDAIYPLAMPGLIIEVRFTWEHDETGADSLLVMPPDGMICDPLDCLMVVQEGQHGRVLLIEWIGG